MTPTTPELTGRELIESKNPAYIGIWDNPDFIASRADVINGSGTSLIHLLPSGRVIKNVYPESPEERFIERLEIESQIYARLPKKHPRLLEFFSYSREEGLVLEYLPEGDLGRYLRGEEPMTRLGTQSWPLRGKVEISPEQRLQWACDAAEGLALLHEHGIWHCDVRAMNFLLDEELRLKIIDFEGSSLDAGEAMALEATRFFLLREWREPSTARTEVFALGSLVYEIMTGGEPYAELGDEEVTERFGREEFPDVEGLVCGDVMMECWLGEVKSAEEAYLLVKAKM